MVSRVGGLVGARMGGEGRQDDGLSLMGSSLPLQALGSFLDQDFMSAKYHFDGFSHLCSSASAPLPLPLFLVLVNYSEPFTTVIDKV